MKIWATLHAILHNPVVAAKMIATLDHISGGRAGLNIVAGAYRGEFEQMDAWDESLDHDARYDLTEEWTHHRQAAVDAKTRVDFAGQIFHHQGLRQRAQAAAPPDLICAGMSERGFDFSVRHADACFIGGRDEAETRAASLARQGSGGKTGQDDQDLCHVHRDLWRQRRGGRTDRAHYREGLDEGAVLGMLESYGVAGKTMPWPRAPRAPS